MITSWSFHTPTRVHFGNGCRRKLAGLVAGRRILAVTTLRGRGQMQQDAVLGPIMAAADVTWVDSVSPNPGLIDTQTEIDRLNDQSFDLVVAFGGGSAMDAAKALAAALTPGLACRDLATLIVDPTAHLVRPLLPIVALTTTSGTGAEVTPFATIWDHTAKKKLSLASDHLFPHTAIVDPELTWDLPRDPTLSTGLDALNQAFESVWNRNASPVTLGFAGRAIGLAIKALPRLNADLDDYAARALIAEASLLAGLAISQTRTAICHSMSYPLTAHFGLAHGWACAATMGAAAANVLDQAPASLEAVAPLAGYSDAVSLVSALDGILDHLSVTKIVSAAISDQKAILALVPQMFTPGRSDNFILSVDITRIETILRASFR